MGCNNPPVEYVSENQGKQVMFKNGPTSMIASSLGTYAVAQNEMRHMNPYGLPDDMINTAGPYKSDASTSE